MGSGRVSVLVITGEKGLPGKPYFGSMCFTRVPVIRLWLRANEPRSYTTRR